MSQTVRRPGTQERGNANPQTNERNKQEELAKIAATRAEVEQHLEFLKEQERTLQGGSKFFSKETFIRKAEDEDEDEDDEDTNANKAAKRITGKKGKPSSISEDDKKVCMIINESIKNSDILPYKYKNGKYTTSKDDELHTTNLSKAEREIYYVSTLGLGLSHENVRKLFGEPSNTKLHERIIAASTIDPKDTDIVQNVEKIYPGDLVNVLDGFNFKCESKVISGKTYHLYESYENWFKRNESDFKKELNEKFDNDAVKHSLRGFLTAVVVATNISQIKDKFLPTLIMNADCEYVINSAEREENNCTEPEDQNWMPPCTPTQSGGGSIALNAQKYYPTLSNIGKFRRGQSGGGNHNPFTPFPAGIAMNGGNITYEFKGVHDVYKRRWNNIRREMNANNIELDKDDIERLETHLNLVKTGEDFLKKLFDGHSNFKNSGTMSSYAKENGSDITVEQMKKAVAIYNKINGRRLPVMDGAFASLVKKIEECLNKQN